MFISNKKIPSKIVNRENKLSNSFTNTFEVLDIIGLRCFNLFVFDIFGHMSQRLLDVISIRDKMF